MTIRDTVSAAVKDAMRAKAADRLSTLRLISSAIKDRDIAARGEGAEGLVGDDAVLGLLGKMVKQRQESARAFDIGNRPELAAKELAEIKLIEEFLPRQLTEAESAAALEAAIAQTGASGLRDMGKVMAELKSRYTGQMDFAKVGALVKARLG